MQSNLTVVEACIAQAQALRYTPAGLPAIDLQLEHQSQQTEAGATRTVHALIRAVAFGPLAEQLARQPLGSLWRFSGFLATPRNGKQLVLHLQSIQPLSIC